MQGLRELTYGGILVPGSYERNAGLRSSLPRHRACLCDLTRSYAHPFAQTIVRMHDYVLTLANAKERLRAESVALADIDAALDRLVLTR